MPHAAMFFVREPGSADLTPPEINASLFYQLAQFIVWGEQHGELAGSVSGSRGSSEDGRHGAQQGWDSGASKRPDSARLGRQTVSRILKLRHTRRYSERWNSEKRRAFNDLELLSHLPAGNAARTPQVRREPRQNLCTMP